MQDVEEEVGHFHQHLMRRQELDSSTQSENYSKLCNNRSDHCDSITIAYT